MGTRCAIGRVNPDGSVSAVFCALDGGPDHAGRVLEHHYNDDAALDALLALGPLNSLGASPEEPLDYQDSVRTTLGMDFQDAMEMLKLRCVRFTARPDLHDPFQAASEEEFRCAVLSHHLDHAYLRRNGAWHHVHGPPDPAA